MNNEELFLKYLDNQLSHKERQKVEVMLKEDSANVQLFDKVKSTRTKVLNSLDCLNPIEPIVVPPFEKTPIEPRGRKMFRIKRWHYAAMIALLPGIYFIIKESSVKTDEPIVDIVHEEIKKSKTIYKELDCYISPNRCWNQKQLVCTIIEINH